MRACLLALVAGCSSAVGSPLTVSGGGGGSSTNTALGLWSPFVAQDPLATETDYFDDSSLDAKWSEWDQPGAISVTEDSTGLHIDRDTTAAGIAGIYQDVPASGDWVATAYGGIECTWDTDTSLDIFVAEDLDASPGTANVAALRINCTGDGPWYQHFPQYNTFGGGLEGTTTDQGLDPNGMCIRLCYDATNNDLTALVSSDCRIWRASVQVADATTTVNPPVHVGIGIGNQGNVAGIAHFQMFRMDATSDCFLPVGGDGS